MFRRNLYKTSNSEIDLRNQFDQLVFGKGNKLAHNHLILLRKPKMVNGEIVKCTCVNTLTDEANTEGSCGFCLGEGYIWEEKFHRVYSSLLGLDGGKANRTRRIMAGEIRTDYKVFYFKFDSLISYKDKIIELRLDNEGNPSLPYKRETIYKPETIEEFRSDNGRLEYIAVFAREESSIRDNK